MRGEEKRMQKNKKMCKKCGLYPAQYADSNLLKKNKTLCDNCKQKQISEQFTAVIRRNYER